MKSLQNRVIPAFFLLYGFGVFGGEAIYASASSVNLLSQIDSSEHIILQADTVTLDNRQSEGTFISQNIQPNSLERWGKIKVEALILQNTEDVQIQINACNGDVLLEYQAINRKGEIDLASVEPKNNCLRVHTKLKRSVALSPVLSAMDIFWEGDSLKTISKNIPQNKEIETVKSEAPAPQNTMPKREELIFSDVLPGSPFEEAIIYAHENQIVKGYDDGTFQPEKEINRAEFTKVIIGSLFEASEIDACTETYFSDTTPGDWYNPYICLAYQKNIIDGYDDGTFLPGAKINLAEASKILSNSFATETEPDAQLWYRPFIKALGAQKVIPISVKDVEQKISRGEMVEMIFRLKENITSKESQKVEQLLR